MRPTCWCWRRTVHNRQGLDELHDQLDGCSPTRSCSARAPTRWPRCGGGRRLTCLGGGRARAAANGTRHVRARSRARRAGQAGAPRRTAAAPGRRARRRQPGGSSGSLDRRSGVPGHRGLLARLAGALTEAGPTSWRPRSPRGPTARSSTLRRATRPSGSAPVTRPSAWSEHCGSDPCSSRCPAWTCRSTTASLPWHTASTVPRRRPTGCPGGGRHGVRRGRRGRPRRPAGGGG